MKKILAFQNGIFLIDDGTALNPSEIKGNPRVGLTLNHNNEIIASDVDENCVGGQCPIK